MALADDPREHILHMFQMEMRGNPTHRCRIFSDGARPPGLPLDETELVFGAHNETHFFTPDSLIIVENNTVTKVRWAKIRACSSKHGDGRKTSKLTLIDGTSVDVSLRDFAPGWASRISQLYHAVINRWGVKAFSGFPLLSIRAFFEQAKNEYSIAPNLEPHPDLSTMRALLNDIEDAPGVSSVLLDVSDYDEGEACVQRIVVVSHAPANTLATYLEKLGASEAFLADENTRRRVGALETGAQVFLAVWD
jgi:hypothetical protein